VPVPSAQLALPPRKSPTVYLPIKPSQISVTSGLPPFQALLNHSSGNFGCTPQKKKGRSNRPRTGCRALYYKFLTYLPASSRFRAPVVAARSIRPFRHVIPVGVAATAGRELIAPRQRYLVAATNATVSGRKRHRQPGTVYHIHPSGRLRYTSAYVRPAYPTTPLAVFSAFAIRARRQRVVGVVEPDDLVTARAYVQTDAGLFPRLRHSNHLSRPPRADIGTREAEYFNPGRRDCQRDFGRACVSSTAARR
jgi:hypothetical protein